MSLVQSAPAVEAISGGVVAVGPAAASKDSESPAPGGLLQELERRQDEVLAQIDALDAKLTAILGELGVTLAADPEEA